MIDSSGIARKAPIGPHSHVQKARASSTRSGLNRGQSEDADGNGDNQNGADPGRNAEAFSGFEQWRQRQRDHCGNQRRQQDLATEIEKTAEQDQEDVEIGRLASSPAHGGLRGWHGYIPLEPPAGHLRDRPHFSAITLD